jgi:hypothetical protein
MIFHYNHPKPWDYTGKVKYSRITAVSVAVLGLFLFSSSPGRSQLLEGFESGIPASWTVQGIVGTQGAATNISPTQGDSYAYIDNGGASNYTRNNNASPVSTAFTGVSNATVGSTLLSSPFNVPSGDSISLDLNYLTNDGQSAGGGLFADFAYVQLLNSANNNVVATLYNASAANNTSPQAVPDNNALAGLPGISPGVSLSPSTGNMDGVNTGPVNGIVYGPQSSDVYGLYTGSTGWITSTYMPSAGSYQLFFVASNYDDTSVPSALAVDNIRLNGPVNVPEPGTLTMLFGMGLSGLGMFCRRKLA